MPYIRKRFYKKLIVSCQAPEGDVFHDSNCIARFARAAVEGGAAGIRANGVEDIKAIRDLVRVPIIGIQKTLKQDGKLLITSSFVEARDLIAAGADLIALDCTVRGNVYGAIKRLKKVKLELGVPVMADIATVEEAVTAAEAGADLVATTMRGFTAETDTVREFEPSFVAKLVQAVDIPVVAEGRIRNPELAREAISAGAFAVVVGTAITVPRELTRRFCRTLEIEHQSEEAKQYFLGVDLGGTRTKSGIVSSRGELINAITVPTPSLGGKDVLLAHLKAVVKGAMNLARQRSLGVTAVGVATAGWVDSVTGRVCYATDNLPGWTGACIANDLQKEVSLEVAVENDSNAVAVGEKYFGEAKEVDNFVCMTLGTGVGGGAYVGGRLNQGAHFLATAVGHIPIELDGKPCTCGRKGCLEAYTNGAALLGFANGCFRTAEKLIAAANSGHPVARHAIRTHARYLAVGARAIIDVLDPELLVLSGGIVQNNSLLLSYLKDDLRKQVTAWDQRQLQVRLSQLGYYAGVIGAAAVAREKFKMLEDP